MAVQWIAVLFTTATITTAAPVSDSCQAQITQDHPPYIIGSGGTLKLTCHAINCPAVERYHWDYTTNIDIDCQETSGTVNTCTYQPRVEDAEKTVRCRVVFSSDSSYLEVSWKPDIFYSPSSAPTVTTSVNVTMEPLRNRDIINCSVAGGKPLVSSVNFSCVDPDLPDQRDVINGENVTSYIIVDTSRATQKLMTCKCSATWGPAPDLYTQSVSKQFPLQFAATITNFTVDGSDRTTVSEGDNVQMQCSATGRPAASLQIDFRGSQVANSTAPLSNNSLELVESQMGVDLNSVACNQTGTYTCLADNGVHGVLNQSVFLNVTCPPREADDTFKDGRIPQMNKTGLTFELEANPPPARFSYTFLGRTTDEKSASRSTNDSQFDSECISLQNREFIARCSVRPVKVRPEYVGTYRAIAASTQGSYTFLFDVTEADDGDIDVVPASDSVVTLTVSITVPGGIIIIITITITVAVCRRRRRQQQAGGRAETQRPSDGDEAMGNSDTVVLPSSMDSPAVDIQHHNVVHLLDQGALWTGSEAATYVNAIATSRNVYDFLQLGQSESIYTGLVTSQARADAKADKSAGRTNNEEDYEIPVAPLEGKKSGKKTKRVI